MNDTKSGDDKTLSVNAAPKATLTLKRPSVEQSTVRQNFSHGRTKAVVVETKKSKFSRPDEKAKQLFTPAPAAPAAPAAAAPAVPRPSTVPLSTAQRTEQRAPQPQRGNSGMVLNVLSNDEMAARRRALEGSVVRDAQDRVRAQEDATRRADDDARRKREAEESERRQADEEVRLKREADARRKAEDEAKRRAPGSAVEEEVRPGTVVLRPGAVRRPVVEEEDDRAKRRPGAGPIGVKAPVKAEVRPAKAKVEVDNRRKITVTSVTSDDGEGARGRSMAATRRRQEKFRRSQMQEVREKITREVILPETISIQ